jgi:hypothetical protein
MGCVSPNVVFVRCVETPFEAAVVSLLDKKVHILSGAQVQATGVLLGQSSDSTGLPGGPGWVKVMDIRPVCKQSTARKSKKKVLALPSGSISHTVRS